MLFVLGQIPKSCPEGIIKINFILPNLVCGDKEKTAQCFRATCVSKLFSCGIGEKVFRERREKRSQV